VLPSTLGYKASIGFRRSAYSSVRVCGRHPEWLPQRRLTGGVLASIIGPSGALTPAQGLSLDWHHSDPCSSGTVQAFYGSRSVFQGGTDQLPIYRFLWERENRSSRTVCPSTHPWEAPSEQEPFSPRKFKLDRLHALRDFNRFGTSKVPLYRHGSRNVATSRSRQGVQLAWASASASSWPA
jgi:hypothetical protein